MTKKTLHLASVGWLNHRDEALIQSIVLMSRNIDEVVYPIIDSANTFQTIPLVFDFLDRPVVFRYNQEGPDLFDHIKNNILARSKGVLVSLGGYVTDLNYLQKETQGDVLYLKALINIVKQSDLPTIYALHGNVTVSNLSIIKKLLGISASDIFMVYNYFQPGKLKQVLVRLFEISTEVNL